MTPQDNKFWRQVVLALIEAGNIGYGQMLPNRQHNVQVCDARKAGSMDEPLANKNKIKTIFNY